MKDMENILWELMELEAPRKFFVNGAEHPAFLLFPKYHYCSTKGKVSLYMNSVGLIATFTSERKALDRLKEIIEKANYPCRISQSSKYGKDKGKRFIFAENKIQRWSEPDPDKPARTFNIEEWMDNE